MLLMIPGPTNIPPRIMDALKRPIMNHRGTEFREMYKYILEKLKYAFQTENDVFPLTCSGTGGVECAINNSISEGDKVIIPVNGLFSERIRDAILRIEGVPVEIQSRWGSVCNVEDVKITLDTNRDVKAIALVYNETSTGTALRDLPEIGKLAKKYDKLLIVDAISVMLGDDLPVDEWNIDLCITGSQKCFACPPGLAMISASEKAYQIAAENRRRSYYQDLITWREFKPKNETPFTPAVPLYYALQESLKMLDEEGVEKKIMRHKICAEAFYTALEMMSLKFMADMSARSNTVIVPYLPENVEDQKFRTILRDKYSIAVAGGSKQFKGKTFRIGSMGIVSKPEVITTLDGIIKSFVEIGYIPEVKEEDIIAIADKILSHL